jgi:large subunit ribosomal protein L19
MKAKGYTKETIKQIGMQERNFPEFKVGDTIAVEQRVNEGDKTRLQTFEGDVIVIRRQGNGSTFTVRRIGAHGVGVERVYPFYSPLVESIKLVRKGVVRRAKLYYIRGRVGKAARIKEKITKRDSAAQSAQAKRDAAAQKENA